MKHGFFFADRHLRHPIYFFFAKLLTKEISFTDRHNHHHHLQRFVLFSAYHHHQRPPFCQDHRGGWRNIYRTLVDPSCNRIRIFSEHHVMQKLDPSCLLAQKKDLHEFSIPISIPSKDLPNVVGSYSLQRARYSWLVAWHVDQ